MMNRYCNCNSVATVTAPLGRFCVQEIKQVYKLKLQGRCVQVAAVKLQ